MKIRILRNSIKKHGGMLLFLLLVGILTGCEAKAPKEVDTSAASKKETENIQINSGGEPNKEEGNSSTVTASIKSDTEQGTNAALQGGSEEEGVNARKAFKKVLNGIIEQHSLPDGQPLDWNEFSDMAKNEFAIYDVDQDGKEELLIRYTDASMAGMLEIVYAFDSSTNSVRQQILVFPGITYYKNGILEAPLSHGTGLSGVDFWPYNLFQYDPADDAYHNIAMVDSWDKSIAENDFNGTVFPKEDDIDQDGVIYYILKEGEYEYKDPIDRDEYDKWLEGYIQNSYILEIPYVNITQDNIERVK